MMSTALKLELTDGEPHSVEEISRVSKDLMNVLAGSQPDTTRPPGLLITTEDVRRIRRYVNTALALPTELNEVQYLLGYEATDISGLEPQAIQALHVDIKAHAKTWTELETNMQKVGSDLYVFAGNLITIAVHMIEYVKSLDAYQTLQVGDLSPEQIDRMPPVELVEGDRKKLPGLLALVDDLKIYVKEHSASTTLTRVGVKTFKRVLKDDIAPGVSLKIRLVSSGSPEAEVNRLTEEIAHLNQRIEQKLAEYEEYSDYKWIGFWWGVIPGVISVSIYGPKATAALEEKDRLVEEKRKVEKNLEGVNMLLASLTAFETSLQDLKSRVDGAASGVSNIESLWVLLEELVDSSYDRIKNIHNGLYLVSFVSRFQTLMSNWTEIKGQAFDLLTAFNKALDEPSDH